MASGGGMVDFVCLYKKGVFMRSLVHTHFYVACLAIFFVCIYLGHSGCMHCGEYAPQSTNCSLAVFVYICGDAVNRTRAQVTTKLRSNSYDTKIEIGVVKK